jgi:hypothetical protein
VIADIRRGVVKNVGKVCKHDGLRYVWRRFAGRVRRLASRPG